MNKKTLVTLCSIATLSSFVVACHSGGSSSLNNPTTNKVASSSKLGADDTNAEQITLGLPAVNVGTASNPDMQPIRGVGRYINIHNEDPIDLQGLSSQFKYVQDKDLEEILSTMGIDGSLKIAVKDKFALNGAAEYDKRDARISSQIRGTYLGYVKGIASLRQNYELDPGYKNLPVEDRGDGYISDAIAGMWIEATVVLQFKNSTEKQKIAANGDIDVSDLVGLAGKFEKLDEATRSNISISVEIRQLGGDPQNVFTILNKNFDKLPGVDSATIEDGVDTLSLSSLTPKTVSLILDNIQQYISTPGEIQVGDDKVLSFYSQAKAYQGKTTLTYDEAKKLYFVLNQNTKLKAYPAEIVPYAPNLSLVKAISSHSTNYANLMKRGKDINAYNDIVRGYFYTNPNEEFARTANGQRKEVANKMFDTAKHCYGIIAKAEEAECISDLNAQSEEAKKIVDSVDNDKKWRMGYTIAKYNGVQDYLLPLGTDEQNNKYYYLYSTNPSRSVFMPGSEYQYDTKTGKLLMATPSRNDKAESEIAMDMKISSVSPTAIGLDDDKKYLDYKNAKSATSLPSFVSIENRFSAASMPF